MSFNIEKQYPSINEHIGFIEDGIDKLLQMCEKRAKELLTSDEVIRNRNIDFIFWTKYYAELIGIVKYREDAYGNITYEFDTTRCTL